MCTAQLLTVFIVHMLGVMSPGPDFAVVTRNSLIYSRKAGVYTALGIALGISVHVAYSILGIAVIIAQSMILFNIIKYIGAAYLIYIGYKALRARKSLSPANAPEQTVHQKDISIFKALRIGFLTNLLNPKATLFFLALFTQVIDPHTPKYIQMLFGSMMMVSTFAWFAGISVLFSNNIVKLKLGRMLPRIEKVMGVALIALGIKVAFLSND